MIGFEGAPKDLRNCGGHPTCIFAVLPQDCGTHESKHESHDGNEIGESVEFCLGQSLTFFEFLETLTKRPRSMLWPDPIEYLSEGWIEQCLGDDHLQELAVRPHPLHLPVHQLHYLFFDRGTNGKFLVQIDHLF